VTILGITSTTGQTLNDEGADPNQLVSITDNLAATSLPSESFTVVETAAYGDALRGVVRIPGGSLSSLVEELFEAGMIDKRGNRQQPDQYGGRSRFTGRKGKQYSELDAQAGKHVTQQAHDLLQAAALYYIGRLS
jgi:hypothetical protein